MSELWPHQREAIDFAAPRPATMLNAGMGCGKTRIALELGEKWDAYGTLVLCPVAAMVNHVWPTQHERHCKDEFNSVAVIELCKGTVAQRTQEARDWILRPSARRTVLILNYEAAWREPMCNFLMTAAREGALQLLVLDEIHRIKDPFGKASKFVDKLARAMKWRVGLTGTLMPNSPLDVFAQYRALDPRILGWSFVQFRARYAVMKQIAGHPQVLGFKNQDELASRLAPITFKVGREVLNLLPTITETIHVDLGPKARRAYMEMEKLMRVEIDGAVLTASNALSKLLRLQQLTGGALPLDTGGVGVGSVEVDTAKRDALADLLVDAGEPFVVFCRFWHDLDAVHAACAENKISSCELSGRKRELELWTKGERQVLVCQQQTGKESIDLTRARLCAFYSLGFSLGDYDQAVARLSRPGQAHGVVVYHMVARATVDEQVHEAITEKRDIVDVVMNYLKAAQTTGV